MKRPEVYLDTPTTIQRHEARLIALEGHKIGDDDIIRRLRTDVDDLLTDTSDESQRQRDAVGRLNARLTALELRVTKNAAVGLVRDVVLLVAALAWLVLR